MHYLPKYSFRTNCLQTMRMSILQNLDAWKCTQSWDVYPRCRKRGVLSSALWRESSPKRSKSKCCRWWFTLQSFWALQMHYIYIQIHLNTCFMFHCPFKSNGGVLRSSTLYGCLSPERRFPSDYLLYSHQEQIPACFKVFKGWGLKMQNPSKTNALWYRSLCEIVGHIHWNQTDGSFLNLCLLG